MEHQVLIWILTVVCLPLGLLLRAIQQARRWSGHDRVVEFEDEYEVFGHDDDDL